MHYSKLIERNLRLIFMTKKSSMPSGFFLCFFLAVIGNLGREIRKLETCNI